MALPAVALVAVAVIALLALAALATAARARRATPFLDGATFKPLTLTHRVELTHNTRMFRFALDHPSQRLGLPTGQHITLKCVTPEGEEVMKPYTPVTDDSTLGVVEFVVKVYPAGRVSRALDALAVGDRVLAKGPRGRFRYARGMASHIGMVAGGTGITPCYQVAAAALADPDDTTKFSLVFANVTADDVLIKDRLDALARAHPTRFAAHYVLNDPPPAWAGSVGFVTPDIIKRQLPPPGEGVLVVRCGPPPMNKAVGAALDGLGYGREAQFEF